MTLTQLRYVIAAADTGSMNEAAKKLFISQPSLSQALRELGGTWAPSSQSDKPAKLPWRTRRATPRQGSQMSLWQKLIQTRPNQV